MFGYFKCILYIFSRRKNNRVIPVTYTYVDTKFINLCYGKLKRIVEDYAHFIKQIIPNMDEGAYVLSLNKYSKRNEYVSHFDALYNSILNELSSDGVSKTLINYITLKINIYKNMFDEMDALFIKNIKTLNDSKKLAVDNSAIYTHSFLKFFKDADIPPVVIFNVNSESK